jgi:hypothetical protein
MKAKEEINRMLKWVYRQVDEAEKIEDKFARNRIKDRLGDKIELLNWVLGGEESIIKDTPDCKVCKLKCVLSEEDWH